MVEVEWKRRKLKRKVYLALEVTVCHVTLEHNVPRGKASGMEKEEKRRGGGVGKLVLESQFTIGDYK